MSSDAYISGKISGVGCASMCELLGAVGLFCCLLHYIFWDLQQLQYRAVKVNTMVIWLDTHFCNVNWVLIYIDSNNSLSILIQIILPGLSQYKLIDSLKDIVIFSTNLSLSSVGGGKLSMSLWRSEICFFIWSKFFCKFSADTAKYKYFNE